MNIKTLSLSLLTAVTLALGGLTITSTVQARDGHGRDPDVVISDSGHDQYHGYNHRAEQPAYCSNNAGHRSHYKHHHGHRYGHYHYVYRPHYRRHHYY